MLVRLCFSWSLIEFCLIFYHISFAAIVLYILWKSNAIQIDLRIHSGAVFIQLILALIVFITMYSGPTDGSLIILQYIQYICTINNRMKRSTNRSKTLNDEAHIWHCKCYGTLAFPCTLFSNVIHRLRLQGSFSTWLSYRIIIVYKYRDCAHSILSSRAWSIHSFCCISFRCCSSLIFLQLLFNNKYMKFWLRGISLDNSGTYALNTIILYFPFLVPQCFLARRTFARKYTISCEGDSPRSLRIMRIQGNRSEHSQHLSIVLSPSFRPFPLHPHPDRVSERFTRNSHGKQQLFGSIVLSRCIAS